ncbi:MAG: hypothetical protein V7L14_16625 [Nostoc sp.]|uniref:hypothetical protein n=1 Tax=Nostoc sp. TaxID=1180 RepID=UPI002FF4BB36
MTNQKLTLEIPESLFEQLHHLAELTGQSIESLALQSITSNLPCLSEKGEHPKCASLFLYGI